jgi:protein ImuB
VDGVTTVACVMVPSFATAAAERAEPALVDRPLAVVRGTPPVTRVVDANALAREHGVREGLTEAEARARCPALVSRPWCDARLASARHALLDAALSVSPRIEDAAPGTVYVDADGLERLVGDAAAVGRRLVAQARSVGLTARVGVAGSRGTARVAARVGAGAVTVVSPGTEIAFLGPVPLSVLDLPEAVARPLARWGVRTLGELGALPRRALGMRLGPAALDAQDVARACDVAPFQAYTPPPFWEEAQGLDWDVDSLPALARVLETLLARLAARLDTAALAADALDLTFDLADASRVARSVVLAHPTREVPLLLALAVQAIEKQPPAVAVRGVGVSAHAVVARPGQGGLWQPPAPAHRDLAALLARLTRLVGADRVGAVVLGDSHRPDAFALTTFTAAPAEGRADAAPAPALVLRRLRPPRIVEVETLADAPARLRLDAVTPVRSVRRSAGPWPTSGEWWDRRGWAHDEWDVELDDGTLWRLAHDRAHDCWRLDAAYD